jgi:tetratricopeptide (TPR) repeat protein
MATHPEELRQQVKLLFDKQAFSEIDQLLTDKILDIHKDAELYSWKARALYKTSNNDQAMFYAQKAIDRDPKYWMGYLARGAVWSNKRETDKAIEDYTIAIGIKPDYPDVYNNRGTAWSDKGENDKAIEDYTKAIELKPDYVNAYNNRGSAWSDKGENDKAIEDYTRAIAIKPDYADAYYNRGLSWSDKGENDKAIEDYTKAITIDPKHTDSYINRGIAWSDKGQNDVAIEDYNTAIAIDPTYADAYNNRGITWSDKGENDKAIEDYNAAIAIDPIHADAYNNRGTALYNKGENDKAIDDYNTAISIRPYYPDAYYNRALCLKRRGDFRLALNEFERLKKMNHRLNDVQWQISDIKGRLSVIINEEIEKDIEKIKNIVDIIRQKSVVDKNVTDVVHYSKLSVADIIASSPDSHLHYSNVIYMNDPQEGKTFIEFLDDPEITNWFEKSSYKNESTIFLGSFLPVIKTTTVDGDAEDQLLLWRTYGKDEAGMDAGGCNFVIDASFFNPGSTRVEIPLPPAFEEIKDAIEQGKKLSGDTKNKLLKVQYIRKNQIIDDPDNTINLLVNYLKEEIKKLIKKNEHEKDNIDAKLYTDTKIFEALTELCHLFKSADYSFEKEVRIIRTEPRNSENILYYKKPDGEDPSPPKHFYIKSDKRILPYIRKIYLGPRVKNPSHWSLHFDYSLRKSARKEENDIAEFNVLELKDKTSFTDKEKARHEDLKKVYAGINPTKERIKPNEIDIIPSKCRFV